MKSYDVIRQAVDEPGVKAVAALLQTGLLQKVAQQVMGKLRTDVYGHLLQAPPSYFAQRHSGDVLTRLVSDVGQMEFFVTQALSSYVRDTLQAAALLSLCFALNSSLALWNLGSSGLMSPPIF